MLSKELFKKKYETQIKMYLHLLSGAKAVHDILPKFDGKVLNARFINAVKETNIVQGIFYTLEGKSIKVWSNEYRHYSTSDCTVAYIDQDHMHLPLQINEEGRLLYEDSMISIRKKEQEIAEECWDIRFCIDNWDVHQYEWTVLKQQIDAYQKKWDARIRPYIRIE